jgi:hypothetical protein
MRKVVVVKDLVDAKENTRKVVGVKDLANVKKNVNQSAVTVYLIFPFLKITSSVIPGYKVTVRLSSILDAQSAVTMKKTAVLVLRCKISK